MSRSLRPPRPHPSLCCRRRPPRVSESLAQLFEDARHHVEQAAAPQEGDSTVSGIQTPAQPRLAVASVGSPRTTPWTGLLYAIVVAVWAAGVLVLLGQLSFGYFQVLRLRRGSAQVREGETLALLHRLCESACVCPPLLLVSSRVQTPFITGFWSPAIMLPAGHQLEFDGPALRAILAHEVTH